MIENNIWSVNKIYLFVFASILAATSLSAVTFTTTTMAQNITTPGSTGTTDNTTSSNSTMTGGNTTSTDISTTSTGSSYQ